MGKGDRVEPPDSLLRIGRLAPCPARAKAPYGDSLHDQESPPRAEGFLLALETEPGRRRAKERIVRRETRSASCVPLLSLLLAGSQRCPPDY